MDPEIDSMVMYALVRRRDDDGAVRFLLTEKNGSPTFPPTKFRTGENLYGAARRVFGGDLGLPAGSWFPERELRPLANSGRSPRYPGLEKRWWLYPVAFTFTEEGWAALESMTDVHWWTPEEAAARASEPNALLIARGLSANTLDLPAEFARLPSMEARADRWAAGHDGGARIVTREDIRSILGAGDRAFNLRVADPYLSYQRQGLGFTWSFFTPKDKQDIHVHPLPAVEIYGVIEGRLQLWFKPMNERGVRVWRCRTLGPGDWAEVEPLTCHFAAWLDPDGLGTVVKAAGSGELAGVGRLGVAGKTACHWTGPDKKQVDCPNASQCAFPPHLRQLAAEFAKSFPDRDFALIARLADEAREMWPG